MIVEQSAKFESGSLLTVAAVRYGGHPMDARSKLSGVLH
jgi:hypothetical protein